MKLVRETAVYPHAQFGTTESVVYTTLGLVGETGELANKVKKILRGDYSSHTDPRVYEALLDELADCLWYVGACAQELGVHPSALVRRLEQKLLARKSRGTIKGEGDKR